MHKYLTQSLDAQIKWQIVIIMHYLYVIDGGVISDTAFVFVSLCAKGT